MKAASWNKLVLVSTVIILLSFAAITIGIDPYFHYHQPLESMRYDLSNERYQNDGIVKNFDYDALITGTSMTENFKTSEFDEIFGVNSIKVPFSGAYYKEIDENVKQALKNNPNLRVVLRGIDSNRLQLHKNIMKYDSYPTYLYDNNIFNDVYYIFNKSIFFDSTKDIIKCWLRGEEGSITTFDDYMFWNDQFDFSKKTVLDDYSRGSKVESEESLTEAEIGTIRENVQQNIIQTAIDNPDVEFLYFFPPYSIIDWDGLNQNGRTKWQVDVQRVAIEEILPYKNIKLYSFFDKYDLICNLNNYKDAQHYSADINSSILHWIKEEDGLLTSENYEEYLASIYSFYSTYDYDGEIFSEGQNQ